MNFIDVLFPLDIGKKSVCGIENMTNVTMNLSGKEFRKINLQTPRIVYDISDGIKSQKDIEQIVTFFRLCKGRFHSFRFKDWFDYEVQKQILKPIQGGSASYQFIKSYYVNEACVDRKINKIVKNNTKVYINNALQSENSYIVDHNSGVLNFPAPLASDDVVSVDFEFDIEMRFGNDLLNFSLSPEKNIPIMLIEVL